LNLPGENDGMIMREIRGRTWIVGAFPDGAGSLDAGCRLAPACVTIQEALFMGDPIAGEKRPSEY
jgi:hypothetical protein